MVPLCVGIQDYLSLEGDLSYAPGETEKVVPVQLLELGELSSLLDEKQVKQFVMELSNPRQGAKLGVYPSTTVTILDEPGELLLMTLKRFFTSALCCNLGRRWLSGWSGLTG